VLEQAQPELDEQDAANRVVELRPGDLVPGEELLAVGRVVVVVISMSTPAVRPAVAAPAPSAARPCTISSPMARESLTTKPSKPYRPLRHVAQGVAVGVPGTPLSALKLTMTVANPGLDGGLERRQVQVVQPLDRDVGGVVVASASGWP